MKIYIFGNYLLPFDSLPLKLLPFLQKAFPQIDFLPKDPQDEILPQKGELLIIDTIKNLKKVKVIENLKKLETFNPYSLHDFDLSFYLKILKEIGKLKKVIIFGVPPKGDEKEIFSQLKKAISQKLNLKPLDF